MRRHCQTPCSPFFRRWATSSVVPIHATRPRNSDPLQPPNRSRRIALCGESRSRCGSASRGIAPSGTCTGHQSRPGARRRTAARKPGEPVPGAGTFAEPVRAGQDPGPEHDLRIAADRVPPLARSLASIRLRAQALAGGAWRSVQLRALSQSGPGGARLAQERCVERPALGELELPSIGGIR